MNDFREEIYKVVDFLFLCGERLLETDSFILEFTRRKKTGFSEDWRKQIEDFLDEGKNFSCVIDILDKRTNITLSLNQLNPLKLRNLYMEIAAHMDLSEDYQVSQPMDSFFYSYSQTEKKKEELIFH